MWWTKRLSVSIAVGSLGSARKWASFENQSTTMFTFDTKELLMKSNAMWHQSLPRMSRGCISSAVAWWNALPHTECTSCHKFLSVPDQHWPAKVTAEERNSLVHSAVAGQLGGAPGKSQGQRNDSEVQYLGPAWVLPLSFSHILTSVSVPTTHLGGSTGPGTEELWSDGNWQVQGCRTSLISTFAFMLPLQRITPKTGIQSAWKSHFSSRSCEKRISSKQAKTK